MLCLVRSHFSKPAPIDLVRASNGVIPAEPNEEVQVGVTIGKFDAFHIGHQRLFSRLTQEMEELSRERKAKSLKILFSFYPSPSQVLQGIKKPELVNHPSLWPVFPWRMRLALARQFAFDAVYLCRFDIPFSQQSPEDFVERYLVNCLKAKVVVVGEGWRFGVETRGDSHLLEALGKKFGYKVCVENRVYHQNERVSTSNLKDALQRGDIDQVRNFLGRDYSVQTFITHGDQRGRTLGTPTANLALPPMVLPKDGVYATWLRLGTRVMPSVTNIGFRPTFHGKHRVVEAHVIGESPNLYSQKVELTFIKRLRDERQFSTAKELVAAIQTDLSQAQHFFQTAKPVQI